MKAVVILSCLASLALPLPAAATEAVHPWLEWIGRAETTLARVDGYTCLYHKKEVVSPKVSTAGVMRLKFRKPFSVYLEWMNPNGTGGEAIYVDGWNRNRVRVHPGGFWDLLTFNLDVTSRWIMKANRHPITRIGLGNLVAITRANVERGLAASEFAAIDRGPAVTFGRAVHVHEGVLPADPARGYHCRRSVIHVDDELGLPISMTNYDADDRVFEEYGFESFNPAVELTAADFDPANPNYRF